MSADGERKLQHYTRDAGKPHKALVEAASKAQTLTLNTNIPFLAGVGDNLKRSHHEFSRQTLIDRRCLKVS